VQAARFAFIRSAGDLSALVRSAPYTHVVYLGHALEGVNALLPTAGHRISVGQLAQAFAGTAVVHLDLLGCQSASIAADLATVLPGVRIGYLRSKRIDNIECDPRTLQVIRMTIDPQPVLHFGGQPSVKVRRCAVVFLIVAGCHAHSAVPASHSSDISTADYCDMALSALRATVASNDAQPFGLEDVCVRRLASAGGFTFVDARVSERPGASPVGASSCTADGYRVRFDPAYFEKAPTEGVVLLMVSRRPDGLMDFNAVVDQPDWPSKRPGVIGISPCGFRVRHHPTVAIRLGGFCRPAATVARRPLSARGSRRRSLVPPGAGSLNRPLVTLNR